MSRVAGTRRSDTPRDTEGQKAPTVEHSAHRHPATNRHEASGLRCVKRLSKVHSVLQRMDSAAAAGRDAVGGAACRPMLAPAGRPLLGKHRDDRPDSGIDQPVRRHLATCDRVRRREFSPPSGRPYACRAGDASPRSCASWWRADVIGRCFDSDRCGRRTRRGHPAR